MGGGYRGGGGGAYRGGRGYGGTTNVYVAPPIAPFGFGFSPFGFSPFGFSPFGFGFGLPAPFLLLALGGIALTSFRSTRGIEQADDAAGAAYCLQVMREHHSHHLCVSVPADTFPPLAKRCDSREALC